MTPRVARDLKSGIGGIGCGIQSRRSCAIGIGPREAVTRSVADAKLDTDMAAEACAGIRTFDLDKIRSINGARIDLVLADIAAAALRRGEGRGPDDQSERGETGTQTAVETHACARPCSFRCRPATTRPIQRHDASRIMATSWFALALRSSPRELPGGVPIRQQPPYRRAGCVVQVRSAGRWVRP